MRDIRKTEHPPSGRLALYQCERNPEVWELSLPVGVTCPHAKACKTFVHPEFPYPVTTAENQYLCVCASLEFNHKASKVLWHNLRTVLSAENLDQMLLQTIQHVRPGQFVLLHKSGDFVTQAYFQSWMRVMRLRKDVFFEVHTKAVPWLLEEHSQDGLPCNATITVSSGGTHDDLIPELLKQGNVKVRHVAHTHKSLEDQDSILLPDIETLSTLDTATYVVQGVQWAGTISGDVVQAINSGDTLSPLTSPELHQRSHTE